MIRTEAIQAEAIRAEIGALVAATPKAALMGIGIDIETVRSIQPEAARFFLNDQERDWLQQERDNSSPQTLLRLWTVKEAIFKADPAAGERLLGDYTIENPSQWRGNAYRRDRASLRFQYSSVQLDQGFLSIAILVKGQSNA